MPNSFNKDQGQEGQGNNFSNQNPDDNLNNGNGDVNKPMINADDLAALQKRDEHAQTHITTLEGEANDLKTRMAEMQDALDKAKSVESLLEEKDNQTQLTAEEVAAKAAVLVNDNLTAQGVKAQADANFADVSTALTAKFGDDTDEAVKTACEENGMTWDDMVELSKKNPKLAMKLCNVEKAPNAQAMSPTINTSAMQSNNQQAPVRKNVMELRTDRERVSNFQERMNTRIKELTK